MIDQKMQKTGRREILVVDDNLESLKLLRDILGGRGYSVRPASNGRLALKSVDLNVPDLILLDVKMPDLDGYEVCRRLKSVEHSRNVPVIFISALDETSEKVEGFRAGGVDYITKPFEPEEVLARVGTQLRLRELTEHLEHEVVRRTAELAESEKRYSEIVEGTDNLITEVDAEGRLTFVNETARKIFGLSPRECMGRPSFDFIHPDDREATQKSFLQWIEDKKSAVAFENRQISHAGKVTDVHWTVNLHFDDKGNVTSVKSIARDITEQKKAQEALSREAEINRAAAGLSRKLLSPASMDEIAFLILEQAKRLTRSRFGYVGHIDPDTGYFVCPTLAGDDCGVGNKDITFRKFKGLWGWVLKKRKSLLTNAAGEDPRSSGIPPGHIPIHRFLSAPALIGEKLVGQVSVANPDRDYTDRDLEVIERLADLYVIAIRRKRDEEELKKHRDKLEGLIGELYKTNQAYKALSTCNHALVHAKNETELLQEVCKIVKEDCGFHKVWIGFAEQGNENAIRLVARAGYEKDCPDDVSIALDDENGPSPAGIAIRTEKPAITRDIPVNPDIAPQQAEPPEQDFASSAAFPISRNGRAIGALHVCSTNPDAFTPEEITLLTELVDDLSYGITWLRMREERRLAEENLRQSQKLEAIGTLAGGIAHDFNNILGVIIGQAELMKVFGSRNFDTKTMSRLEELLKASDRAKALVAQILSISRRNNHEKQPVEVDLVVKEAVKFLRSSIPSTIEIRQDIRTISRLVICDSTHIHQIVMNLCTNAFHAMKEQGGVLGITLRETDTGISDTDSRPCIELTVSDTGHGMSRDTVAKIFDPYFTTKAKGEGTGLGLAVVHGIVTGLGGRVSVSSSPGRGSLFRVLLPSTVWEKSDLERALAIRTGSETVLLVDDDKPLLNTAREMLENLGYKVTAISDSMRASELFKSRPAMFDLVITDLTMPGMTGIDLAREMLALRPDLPVIICTGFIDDIRKNELESTGVRAMMIHKPPSLGDFAETIRKVLGDD